MIMVGVKLGSMHEMAMGVPQDDTRAAELYKKACDGGDMEGCHNQGRMARDGDGVPKDEQRARQLFGKACEGGYQKACEHH